MTIAWILTSLACVFFAVREVKNYLWSRKHKIVLCHFEWCSFGTTSRRDQAELAYFGMNQHLQAEHGTGPWTHDLSGSSD